MCSGIRVTRRSIQAHGWRSGQKSVTKQPTFSSATFAATALATASSQKPIPSFRMSDQVRFLPGWAGDSFSEAWTKWNGMFNKLHFYGRNEEGKRKHASHNWTDCYRYCKLACSKLTSFKFTRVLMERGRIQKWNWQISLPRHFTEAVLLHHKFEQDPKYWLIRRKHDRSRYLETT